MRGSAATRYQVVRYLLKTALPDASAPDIASRLHISGATLRRHLQAEHTSYQQLLDAVRWYRCRKALARRWLPGKSVAADLGFRETNSFYRAFNRWTGKSYTQYKRELRGRAVEVH